MLPSFNRSSVLLIEICSVEVSPIVVVAANLPKVVVLSFNSTPLVVILTCSFPGSPTLTPVESAPNRVVLLSNNSNPEPDAFRWEPVTTPIVVVCPNNDWVTPPSTILNPSVSKLAVECESTSGALKLILSLYSAKTCPSVFNKDIPPELNTIWVS